MSLAGVSRRTVLRSLAAVVGAGAGLLASAAAVYPGRGVAAARRVARFAGTPADRCSVTRSDVEGPFYIAGAPRRRSLAGPGERGERILIRGKILGPDCKTPIRGALLDVWQADADGNYHGADDDYRLRGQLLTDERGEYEFESVFPGRYRIDPQSRKGFRPAHIHFTVTMPDHAPLTTQLYFRGDPYLGPQDACGEFCGADDPGRIIALAEEGDEGARMRAGTFDIVMQAKKA